MHAQFSALPMRPSGHAQRQYCYYLQSHACMHACMGIFVCCSNAQAYPSLASSSSTVTYGFLKKVGYIWRERERERMSTSQLSEAFFSISFWPMHTHGSLPIQFTLVAVTLYFTNPIPNFAHRVTHAPIRSISTGFPFLIYASHLQIPNYHARFTVVSSYVAIDQVKSK